jgi:hypothetical protein
MSQAVASMPGTLRVLRTIHGALMAAMLLYVYLTEFLLRLKTQPVGTEFYDGIATVALLAAVIAFAIRARMLRPAFAKLRANPNDPDGHRRWRLGSLISDSLALSIVLYGFVLRFTGATSVQAAPFYVGGFVLMLLWWPRRP